MPKLASCQLEPGIRTKHAFSICIAMPQFANGWVVRMYLVVNTDGLATIAINPDIYRVRLPGNMVSGLNSHEQVLHVASLTSGTLKLTSSDPTYVPTRGVTLEVAWTNGYQSTNTVIGRLVLVCANDPAAFHIDRWKPYFKDGKLSVCGSISMCK